MQAAVAAGKKGEEPSGSDLVSRGAGVLSRKAKPAAENAINQADTGISGVACPHPACVCRELYEQHRLVRDIRVSVRRPSLRHGQPVPG
eukprot:1143424-Rhodomonas_salina.1